MDDPKLIMDQLRLMSLANGQLYELQVVNLKAIPLVLFGDVDSEFAIDFDAKTIQYTVSGDIKLSEADKKLRLGYLEQAVHAILGSFMVSVILNKKKNTNASKIRKAGKAVKPRKGSVRGVSGKVRAATKPKNG